MLLGESTVGEAPSVEADVEQMFDGNAETGSGGSGGGSKGGGGVCEESGGGRWEAVEGEVVNWGGGGESQYVGLESVSNSVDERTCRILIEMLMVLLWNHLGSHLQVSTR